MTTNKSVFRNVIFADDRAIVIGATRYYLGRMSASVSTMADWLVRHWHGLDEGTQQIIARDIDEAFALDDQQRARSEPHARLGWDCDRASWSRVRAMYRTPTCCLCGAEIGPATPHKLHLDGERSCDKCAPPECETCGKPFRLGDAVIPNKATRRSRHPGCPPVGSGTT